ncbi:MAG: hypothetical protein WD873_01640, partial [Candidatus Hydrogenedentales bacterium]
MADHILRKSGRRSKPRLAHALIGATVATACVALACTTAWAQAVTHIRAVPAPSLEGNLLGDPAWRQVSIYLPPSYASQPR